MDLVRYCKNLTQYIGKNLCYAKHSPRHQGIHLKGQLGCLGGVG